MPTSEQELMTFAENVVAFHAAVLLGLHTGGDIDAKKLVGFLKEVIQEHAQKPGYAVMLERLTVLLETNYSRPKSSKPSLQVIQGGVSDEPSG
jgi:hypothetical protein